MAFDQMIAALSGGQPVVQRGSIFHRLLVTGEWKKNAYHNKLYRCICECGAETWTRAFQLINGQAKSCGCYRADRARDLTSVARLHLKMPERGSDGRFRKQDN